MRHLQAFVGIRDSENSYTVRVYRVGELLKWTFHFFLCNDDDLFWLSLEPRLSSFFEFIASVDCGNDDCDVFRGDISWIFGEGDGFIDEGRAQSNEIP